MHLEVEVKSFPENLPTTAVTGQSKQIQFPPRRAIETERHHVGLVHRVTSGMYHISECHKFSRVRGGRRVAGPEASGAHGDIHQMRSDITADGRAIGWSRVKRVCAPLGRPPQV